MKPLPLMTRRGLGEPIVGRTDHEITIYFSNGRGHAVRIAHPVSGESVAAALRHLAWQIDLDPSLKETK